MDNIKATKFVIDAKTVTQNDDPNALKFEAIGEAINIIHDNITNNKESDNKTMQICLITFEHNFRI